MTKKLRTDGIDYKHVHRIVGQTVYCTKGVENCRAAQQRQEELDNDKERTVSEG